MIQTVYMNGSPTSPRTMRLTDQKSSNKQHDTQLRAQEADPAESLKHKKNGTQNRMLMVPNTEVLSQPDGGSNQDPILHTSQEFGSHILCSNFTCP